MGGGQELRLWQNVVFCTPIGMLCFESTLDKTDSLLDIPLVWNLKGLKWSCFCFCQLSQSLEDKCLMRLPAGRNSKYCMWTQTSKITAVRVCLSVRTRIRGKDGEC